MRHSRLPRCPPQPVPSERERAEAVDIADSRVESDVDPAQLVFAILPSFQSALRHLNPACCQAPEQRALSVSWIASKTKIATTIGGAACNIILDTCSQEVRIDKSFSAMPRSDQARRHRLWHPLAVVPEVPPCLGKTIAC